MPSLKKQRQLARERQEQRKKAPHLVIDAKAGCGKTTTLIQGLRVMRGLKPKFAPSSQQEVIWDVMKMSDKDSKTAMCAFNSSIAKELKERVPHNVDAMTMHALGLRTLKKFVKLTRGKNSVNGWKVRNLIEELTGTTTRKLDPVLVRATEKIVGLCKMNLFSGEEEHIEFLRRKYDVPFGNWRTTINDLVPRLMERCLQVETDGYIDFNDMIWLPIALNLEVEKYDVFIIDETQDLSPCQQELGLLCGDRIWACGDVNQAIYAFAGADADAMKNFILQLTSDECGCEVLPLTVTRRCGEAIVKEANKYVPNFEAHPDNGPGEVLESNFRAEEGQPTYRNLVREGDMILSRVNAPLITECFKFLKEGRKAVIQGRDIGKSLIRLIEKMNAPDSRIFQERLDEWYHKAHSTESAKKNPNESYLINLTDKYDCLCMFNVECKDPVAMVTKVETMFTDDSIKGILLSSIHKAKGLEAERVFLFQGEFAPCPHPMAKTPEARQQEINLLYVGITRAIKTLVYVH